MELREGENCLQSDTRKYCRKQVTAVGVLDSGFLSPKKSQMLMENQFERTQQKSLFPFFSPLCWFRRIAFFSHLFIFCGTFFVRKTYTSKYTSMLSPSIRYLLPPPYCKHRDHSTAQRSQPARQAAKQVRANHSAITQASRRS